MDSTSDFVWWEFYDELTFDINLLIRLFNEVHGKDGVTLYKDDDAEVDLVLRRDARKKTSLYIHGIRWGQQRGEQLSLSQWKDEIRRIQRMVEEK